MCNAVKMDVMVFGVGVLLERFGACGGSFTGLAGEPLGAERNRKEANGPPIDFSDRLGTGEDGRASENWRLKLPTEMVWGMEGDRCLPPPGVDVFDCGGLEGPALRFGVVSDRKNDQSDSNWTDSNSDARGEYSRSAGSIRASIRFSTTLMMKTTPES